MKLSICSDIHLNFLNEERIVDFVKSFKKDSDALAIVGDISEGDKLTYHLSILNNTFQKPIYFVLGNHDFWKKSFFQVENDILEFCSKHKNCYWLPNYDYIQLTEDTCIAGVDGWYDALYGNWQTSNFIMNDWRYISDFINNEISLEGFINTSRERSISQVSKVSSKIDKCSKKFKNLIFLTHVPPWPEISKKKDNQVAEQYLPYYTSRMMGNEILNKSSQYDKMNITVYSGHCHTESHLKLSKTLEAFSIPSQYGNPQIHKKISII